MLTEPPAPAVLGFYTLAATRLLLRELPPATAKRLPKYPHVPATLLGRLAIDQRARGHSLPEQPRRLFLPMRTVAALGLDPA